MNECGKVNWYNTHTLTYEHRQTTYHHHHHHRHEPAVNRWIRAFERPAPHTHGSIAQNKVNRTKVQRVRTCWQKCVALSCESIIIWYHACSFRTNGFHQELKLLHKVCLFLFSFGLVLFCFCCFIRCHTSIHRIHNIKMDGRMDEYSLSSSTFIHISNGDLRRNTAHILTLAKVFHWK